MRKLVPALVTTAVILASLAPGATASTDTKFKAVGLTQSSTKSGDGVIVRSKLTPPGDRSARIGHAIIKFSPLSHGQVHARGVFAVGGGVLEVRGNFGAGDSQINIVGGNHRWAGATGVVRLHNAGPGAEKYRFSVHQ